VSIPISHNRPYQLDRRLGAFRPLAGAPGALVAVEASDVGTGAVASSGGLPGSIVESFR
jgi:hypothetical protein